MSNTLRSLAYTLNRFVLLRRHLVATVPNGSFRFRIEDAAGRRLYKRGLYEPELTEYLETHLELPEGSVVFDVGANMGWYSVLLSRIAPPSVRIYAFEPDPVNFGLLEDNLRRNGAGNVLPVQAAVAEEPGSRELYLYNTKNTGRHSLLPINDGRRIEVPTIALDAFADEHGIDPADVSFVKIDVEGYELPVLRGASRLLAAGPPLLCEFAPEYMRTGGIDPAELVTLLRDHGYSFGECGPHGLTAADADQLVTRDENTDLILRRAA